MSRILGKEAHFYILPEDPQAICFQYPKVFEDSDALQVIRLEIGAPAAWRPSVSKTIASYAAETYPKIFLEADTTILTVSAERTFGEKLRFCITRQTDRKIYLRGVRKLTCAENARRGMPRGKISLRSSR